jgi:ABC-type transporter Mla subunit MlaD
VFTCDCIDEVNVLIEAVNDFIDDVNAFSEAVNAFILAENALNDAVVAKSPATEPVATVTLNVVPLPFVNVTIFPLAEAVIKAFEAEVADDAVNEFIEAVNDFIDAVNALIEELNALNDAVVTKLPVSKTDAGDHDADTACNAYDAEVAFAAYEAEAAIDAVAAYEADVAIDE